MRHATILLQLLTAVPASAMQQRNLSPAVREYVRVDTAIVALTHVRMIDGTGAPAVDDQTIVIEGERIIAVGDAATTPVPGGAGSVQVQQQMIVLRGGWLIDGVRDEAVPNIGIVVKGGKLLEVGADLTGRDLSGARVIDLEETDYILPGLFDLHAHYEVELFGSGRVDELEVNPVVYLANGVTTTFTAGESNPDRVIEAKKRIDTGFQVGPRILSAGLRVGVGRQGRLRVDATVQDIYDEVDYWVARGVGGFKAKSIRPEHLQALIDRAHLHGLTVTGHLSSGYLNTVNPRDAILMGIDRIEHFLGGDAFAPDVDPYVSLARIDTATTEFRDIVELFIRHRVHFNPTTRAFGYIGSRGPGFEQWVDERKLYTPYVQELAGLNAAMRQGSARFDLIQTIALATVKAFYDAGGQDLIGLGTDTPGRGEYLAGFMVHRELEAFVLAGISPAAAIKFATINGARALNLSDQQGSIESGKFADLFVTKGNPLDDIRNTRNVHTVMKSGTIYDTKALLESVTGKLGPEGPEDAHEWSPAKRTE